FPVPPPRVGDGSDESARASRTLRRAFELLWPRSARFTLARSDPRRALGERALRVGPASVALTRHSAYGLDRALHRRKGKARAQARALGLLLLLARTAFLCPRWGGPRFRRVARGFVVRLRVERRSRAGDAFLSFFDRARLFDLVSRRLGRLSRR